MKERIDENQMSQAGSDWIRVDGDGARLDWIRIGKWIEMEGDEHKSESHTRWLSLLLVPTGSRFSETGSSRIILKTVRYDPFCESKAFLLSRLNFLMQIISFFESPE